MTDEANTTVQDPPLYNVSAFCEAHDISRGYLYQLWSEGRGPRRTKLGRRVVIRGEAAAEWRRQMERETPPLSAEDCHE